MANTNKKEKIKFLSTVRSKQDGAFDFMREKFGYKNKLEAPKIKKVIVSTGIGSVNDKNKIDIIQDALAKITGQKTSSRPAKKSIAAFKLREGDVVGYQVTLRGSRMYAFLDKLFAVALPRTRDFRGLDPASVDEMGNYTVGIREHTIFPETSNEELKDVFGLAVTIVTTAKTKEEARAFLDNIGVPFKKETKSK